MKLKHVIYENLNANSLLLFLTKFPLCFIGTSVSLLIRKHLSVIAKLLFKLSVT